MNIGKFCPLSLCNLIGNFRVYIYIYLYIVSLVLILSYWVCDNWVYRFPTRTPLLKPPSLGRENGEKFTPLGCCSDDLARWLLQNIIYPYCARGFHTWVRGTMFVRDVAVTTGPSRKCDITFFVKGRPKSARQSHDSTVAARSVQSVTIPSSRVSRECRSPGLRSPPLKMPDCCSMYMVWYWLSTLSIAFERSWDITENIPSGSLPSKEWSRDIDDMQSYCDLFILLYNQNNKRPWKFLSLVALNRRFWIENRTIRNYAIPRLWLDLLFVGERLRGNTIRGNRPERFWEGNLPLRGPLRGSLWGRVSEVLRGFQRGFQRFLEVFRGFAKALSETLSECHFPLRVVGRVAPNRVAP